MTGNSDLRRNELGPLFRDISRKAVNHTSNRKAATIILILLFASMMHAQQSAPQCQPCQKPPSAEAWVGSDRYQSANAELIAKQSSEGHVVFFGDSITDAWNLEDSFPGKDYINRGIGGQTTPQMLLRFRQDVVALRPRVVVILAGTNDVAENTGPETLEDIEGNLASMVEIAQANHIRVVLSSILPVAGYP
jgi:hypothetical protein